MQDRDITKSSFFDNLSALSLFFLLLCYLRWPVFNLFSSHLLGGIDGDTNLYFWLVTTFPHNLIERGWFQTNSFYPYQDTLAWSDNFLFPSTVFYFFNTVCGIAEIASWNILILLAQLLNGLSVFLLARRLGGSLSSSFLLGSVFVSVPYFAQNLGHPQLQFFFWIPLGLNAFISLLSKPSWQRSLLLALILALTFLSTIYYAVTLALVCALYFCFLSCSRGLPSKHLIFSLLSSLLFSAFMLVPFLIPYLRVKNVFGPRGLHEFYHFGLSALSFFSAPTISTFYGITNILSQDEAHFGWGIVASFLLILAAKRIWQISPYVLLFGVTALLFADHSVGNALGISRDLRLWIAIGASWVCISSLCLRVSVVKSERNLTTETQRHREIFKILSYVSVVLIILSLGPLGYPEIKVPGLGVFRLFYEFFPGVDSLRAISRLGSVIILLACLSTIPNLNLAGKKILLLVPLLIFESRITSFPLAPLPQAPKIFEKLSSIAGKDDAILISPVSAALDKNNQVISWSELANINSSYLVALRHSRPLLMNGYSGQRPKTIYELPRILKRFPSEAALNSLKKFERLRFVVVLGSRIPGFEREEFERRIAELGERVRVVERDGDDIAVELLSRNLI